jgi:four helix bundle protein
LGYSECEKKDERGSMMKYAEWIITVPAEITNDPIWRLEVYRLPLFAGDIGWNDVVVLSKNKLTWGIADQLHRSLGSISANLTEGYSRSKGLDRARFLEYSLGSARESRDWHYKSRHVLGEEIVEHRIGLHTKIVSMLVLMIPHQRGHAIREEQPEYSTESSHFSLEQEAPEL